MLMSIMISTQQQSILPVCKYAATMYVLYSNCDIMSNHLYYTVIVMQDCLNDAIASQA